MTISDSFKILGSFLDITGSSDLSTDYSLKIDKASGSAIFHVRNDGVILINSIYNNAQLNVKTSPSPLYVNGVFGDASASNGYGVYGVGTYGVVGYTATAAYGNAIYGNASSIPYTGIGGYFVGGITAIIGKSSTSDLNSSILQLMDSGSNVKMNVLGSGYTSIGLTTPTATLHVKGVDSTSSDYALKVDNSAGSSLLSISNDGRAIFSYGLSVLGTNFGHTFVGIAGYSNIFNIGEIGLSNSYFQINTGGTFKLGNVASDKLLNFDNTQFWFNNANVGVGISAPTAKTHVVGTDSTSANYALKVDSASSPLLYVRNDGNVGINFASGVANGTKFYVDGGQTTLNTYAFRIDGDSSNIFNVKNSGNIGIGTLSPTATIHVQGVDSTSANYALKVDSASSPLLYVRNDGNVGLGSSAVSNVSLYIQGKVAALGTDALRVNSLILGTIFSVEDYFPRVTIGSSYTTVPSTLTLGNNNGTQRFIGFSDNASLGSIYSSSNQGMRLEFNNLSTSSTDIFMSTDPGTLSYLNSNVTASFKNNVHIGYGNPYDFNNTIRLYVKGIDSTSSNYALKVDSASSPLLYVRNDGFVSINQTSIGVARLEITGGSFQGAYVQSSGSIAVNGVDPIGLAIKGETSTGTALFAKITNGSGTSGIAIRAHDQSGNIIFTVNGDGNIGFNGTSFGGGAKVIFNAFATTIPTTNPTAGVIDYIENTGGGVHKYRDTNGTIIAY